MKAPSKTAIRNSAKTASPNEQNTLIIADGTCPEIRELLASAHTPVHWLNETTAPIKAISALLEINPCKQLNLVCHGRSGAIRFGHQWINAKVIAEQGVQLATWHLNKIAIWSCEVGQDPSFATTLEQLTGAQVFTSSTKVHRNQAKVHDRSTGTELNMNSIISKTSLMNWEYSLGTVAFTPANVYLLSNVTQPSTGTPTELINGVVVSQPDPVTGESGTGNSQFDITSANNLLVSLTINGSIISGEIQRRITSTGNTLEGLVFFEDINGDGKVTEGGEGGAAYLIANSGITFTLGTPIQSNAANPSQALLDLNALLASDGGNQGSLPTALISDISVSEDSEFAVIEFSLSQESATAISFTPQLVSGTGSIGGTDPDAGGTGSGLEFFDSDTQAWIEVSSFVIVPIGETSILLRTPIIDDNNPEGRETILIETGPISGGGTQFRWDQQHSHHC